MRLIGTHQRDHDPVRIQVESARAQIFLLLSWPDEAIGASEQSLAYAEKVLRQAAALAADFDDATRRSLRRAQQRVAAARAAVAA